MLFSEFRKQILGALTPELSDMGFSFNAARNRFTRMPSRGVAHSIYPLISESYPFARVDIHLGVRLETVERIFHRTSGYDKKHQKETTTMGGALDAITGNPALRMLLDQEHGSHQVRSLLLTPSMRTFYESWFCRFSKIENIDVELNQDPTRETPNRPIPWLRCSTGIIVARMLMKGDYDRLALAYKEVMRTFSNGFYLPRFEQLLQDLEDSQEGWNSGGKS